MTSKVKPQKRPLPQAKRPITRYNDFKTTGPSLPALTISSQKNEAGWTGNRVIWP
ncbi:11744_t:CDS:2 [Funneliformis mosseae]|uniref:11744_t:CDS:1 n=1 Tax=Funneliformis mosseae TaxID=27381 RepID=A0A9N8WCX1_FUNMO|nr:11744_t:CDS:2 [Funneliformis mosseae]